MDIALPVGVLPDYFEKLEARILHDFSEGVTCSIAPAQMFSPLIAAPWNG